MNEIEQKSLMLQMAAGSETAFSQLFNAYSDKLYSFILTISGSKQQAEDTVQEVFLKIWEKRAEVSSINQFDNYLFRMAHNHVLNAMKKMSRETNILNGLSQSPGESHESPNGLELKEVELTVKEAIEKLPNKQRQVFVLSREYGLKQAEISRMLNITIPTVKSHITQAIQFIRKECKNIYPLTKFFLIFLGSFLF